MLATGGIGCVSPRAGQKGKVFSVGQRIQKLGESRIMVTLREEVEEMRGGQFTPTGDIDPTDRKSTSFIKHNRQLFTLKCR